MNEVKFASIFLNFNGDKLNISFENSLEDVSNRNKLDLIFKNPEIIRLCKVFCIGLSNRITHDNVKQLSNLLKSLNYDESRIHLYEFRWSKDDDDIIYTRCYINTYELSYLDGTLLNSLQLYATQSDEIKSVFTTIFNKLSSSILYKI